MNAAWIGFTTGLALIIAIGPQNVFILRQGIANRHVAPVVAFCALSDSILIGVGVASAGALVEFSPNAIDWLRYAGAAFLLAYAARALLSAWRGSSPFDSEETRAGGLGKALLTCAALTWLNPHVYLDTVALMGAISVQFGEHRIFFALGGMMASISFFSALGYSARRLRALFERKWARRALDLAIAAVMSAIACGLLFSSEWK